MNTVKRFAFAIICCILIPYSLYAQTADNLALYRPATASSVGHYPVITDFAVDGQLDTGWRSTRKLTPDTGDVLTIDLQATCQLTGIKLVWASSANQPIFEEVRTSTLFGGEQVASYALAYSVLLSEDSNTWTTVYTTRKGAGGEETINIQPASARYVRVHITERSNPVCGVGINELIVQGTCKEKRPAVEGWPLRRKEKVAPTLVNSDPAAREMILNSGWELNREDWSGTTATEICNPKYKTSTWYNATVPGTVMTTLVNQDVFPEPAIGMNNLQIPECLSRHVWWYRTELNIPKQWTTSDQKLTLEFDGINHVAEIWFNGQPLGTIEGAFMRGKYDITNLINTAGKNILAVRIIPPAHPGVPIEKNETDWVYNGGAQGKDSPAYLSSIGWDWMPPIRDRGIGIWNTVRIRRTGSIVIKDPQVITDLPLPDTTKADISITVPVKNNDNNPVKAVVTAQFDNVTVNKTVTVPANSEAEASFTPAEFSQLSLKNPDLWWPAGYGDQPLYDLTITAKVGTSTSDTHKSRFGVREYSYTGGYVNEEVGSKAEQLVLSINGHKVLCRGGNWGYPELLLRLTPERLEAAIRLHHEANMNMMRNWIGMTTNELLYDLCDKYGILIWNDFWLANPYDGPDPDDHQMFMANVRDTICHYRNHPSIAVWCGRNEGMPPKELDAGMRKLTKELDGTRFYQPHSADKGASGNGPYSAKSIAGYFDEFNKGFKTEMGMPSVPSAESMRKMLDDPNPWPMDIRWAYHDFCPEGNQHRDDYNKAIDTRFGPATDLDDYCRKAQMINYDGYRGMFEGCNHKMWNGSSALLLWMSHPAWPSTVWQVYDYWDATYGSYFGSQKANEPIHIQYCPINHMVEMINHTANPVSGKVTAKLLDLSGKTLWEKEQTLTAKVDSKTDSFAIKFPADCPAAYLIKLYWHDEQGGLLSENIYWLGKQEKDLQALSAMPKVKLDVEMIGTKQIGPDRVTTVKLANPTDDVALMTVLTLRDSATGERVLPAYYSDNYLSLLPGEERMVTITFPTKNAGDRLTLILDGWNIASASIR